MAVWSLSGSLVRSSLVPWLGRLATVVMLAVLAWMGARVFWSVTTGEVPLPPATIDTEPRAAAQAIVSRHPFGEASGPSVAGPSSDIRLSGVIAAAGPGQTAMAFLAVDGKPAAAVWEGGEVAPGISLKQVLARHVELSRGGQTQVLVLPEPAKALPQPAKR